MDILKMLKDIKFKPWILTYGKNVLIINVDK